jgi:AcrR family transcriptional regulator
MSRGRASNYDAQAELILERAAELFATQGYAGTSMNQVAAACSLSKATLYHYYRDKYALLVQITEGHVVYLHALVAEVAALGLPPRERLTALIERFVLAYAGARHAHRVLTEDVRFLEPADQARVLDTERELVNAIAETVSALRPELHDARLAKPLTMLLFGMINWMFTWMRPEGQLDHEAMAPIVADLFLGGLQTLKVPLALQADVVR